MVMWGKDQNLLLRFPSCKPQDRADNGGGGDAVGEGDGETEAFGCHLTCKKILINVGCTKIIERIVAVSLLQSVHL